MSDSGLILCLLQTHYLMTADSISHQTSTGYCLLMNNRQTDVETGLRPLRGRKVERGRGVQVV